MEGPVAESSKQAQHHRLTAEGYRLLRDYFENVSHKPPSAEKRDLLYRIQRLPGCEWYTRERLDSYFLQARRTSKLKGTKEHAPSHYTDEDAYVRSILFPSFHPYDISKLRVLLKHNPSPTPRSMQIWAESLAVDPDDVRKWVELEKEQGSKSAHDDPMHQSEEYHRITHLPTPEPTASPEPRKLLNLPQTPILPSSSSFSPVSSTASQLADTIHDSLLSTHYAEAKPFPTSPDAFVARFASFERNMQSFMDGVASGEYAHIGLDSSCIPPQDKK
ncbi:hypothetical protein C8Q75DRAFT_742157 [Abortiporus biennis]|nr:hypothetical protein C8Q75DRAFT_742157 [Abortiporus biennis]